MQNIEREFSSDKDVKYQHRGVELNKSLPIAALIGCCIGGAVYQYLLSDWFFVAGVTAIYTGIAYFILAYDITLLGEQFTFDESYDRLGHAIGVFGLSISPLALIEHVDLQTSGSVSVLIWIFGVIAYFTIVSAAQSQQRQ